LRASPAENAHAVDRCHTAVAAATPPPPARSPSATRDWRDPLPSRAEQGPPGSLPVPAPRHIPGAPGTRVRHPQCAAARPRANRRPARGPLPLPSRRPGCGRPARVGPPTALQRRRPESAPPLTVRTLLAPRRATHAGTGASPPPPPSAAAPTTPANRRPGPRSLGPLPALPPGSPPDIPAAPRRREAPEPPATPTAARTSWTIEVPACPQPQQGRHARAITFACTR